MAGLKLRCHEESTTACTLDTYEMLWFDAMTEQVQELRIIMKTQRTKMARRAIGITKHAKPSWVEKVFLQLEHTAVCSSVAEVTQTGSWNMKAVKMQ